MSAYARLAVTDAATDIHPVTPGVTRGFCATGCDGQMYAAPGNGQMAPHWAHFPGSAHVKSFGGGEKGEWHQEVQAIFKALGALNEVDISAADLDDHRADIVLADGRVIEAQTTHLSADAIRSREATYGDMAWIYDARDFGSWFIVENADSRSFVWGSRQKRNFCTHTKPIYLDTGTGVWQLDSIAQSRPNGMRGYVLWNGMRTHVAAGLLELARDISAGAPFCSPPRMPFVDPAKTLSGTRAQAIPTPDEWLTNHKECHRTEPLGLFTGSVAIEPGRPDGSWMREAGITAPGDRVACPRCGDDMPAAALTYHLTLPHTNKAAA